MSLVVQKNEQFYEQLPYVQCTVFCRKYDARAI